MLALAFVQAVNTTDVVTLGTRAYQMALYVCFESGLQMLADSPTRYLREEACTQFIASVPTTWAETRVLAAKAGDYYVVAKRKGAASNPIHPTQAPLSSQRWLVRLVRITGIWDYK